MARDLAEKTGYYLKDIKTLLSAMDEQVKEYFSQVTDEDDIAVQICEGVKISAHVVEPRERINPKTREAIVCGATVKPAAKFSQDFRAFMQAKYEENN
jgi:nucleoid DNA-binding protein